MSIQQAGMTGRERKLYDPNTGFAEAEKRIQHCLNVGSKRLDLSLLNLAKVPDSIGQLRQLRTLDLSVNQLTALPESLGNLVRLQRLDFCNNHLIATPTVLGQLIQLQRLSIGGSQLDMLPEWVVKLKRLQVLDLAGYPMSGDGHGEGRLTVLPNWLCQLTQLRELNLSGNQLTSLPECLRELKMLEKLYLQGNDALSLPPEVIGSLGWMGGTKAKPSDILGYYFRTRAGKRPLNEAKLILLGRGEVGKTCLVNRLVYDKFVPTFITRGIAITQWSVTSGNDMMRLNVWDFGGQEIQHATHQFFLTERSIYLVVLNGRAGAEDEDAEYWLKFVKTFGASSPTIVVSNKFKVQPFQLNRRALREKYPFIRAFLETDCKSKTNNGRAELVTAIETALAGMPHVRADFPADWFAIKERIASMKEPFISFEKYRKICEELGEKETYEQDLLAGFLDDLGIALNFRGDQNLREETVLNPHWITEGVYQIITSKQLAKQKGELRLADLEIIFKGKQAYPLRMHRFLIELMRKFELCFSYHDDPNEHRYLIPELLEKEQPDLKEAFPPVECMNFRYDYRLMPEGLLPRFITRTHTMSQPSERWRTGVVLRWESCRALVKADKQERQVIIRVMGEGEKLRRLLAVVRENFDQIHAGMEEFKPMEWVALEGHPEDWVSYSELEILEKKNVTELPKSAGQIVVSINVSQLLDATDVPGARARKEMATAERPPLKLFISYAHEDERWRAKLAPNLALLEREGLLQVWCDLQIKPGEKWDDEIKQKLNEADIFLFLMSTDLLASAYVQEVELPIARIRHEKKTACIVPIVVRACSWTKYLGDIQGLPKAGKPVKEWADKDQAFHGVELGLRKTISDLRARREF